MSGGGNGLTATAAVDHESDLDRLARRLHRHHPSASERTAAPVEEVRRCALYARVSTVRQAMIQDGGLDTQLELMERRVHFENDSDPVVSWVVQDQYREEGWSGKNLDRPEFKRLMAQVEAGQVNTVIVQKIDRITRSLRDFYDLWERFERYGVQFISLHEKFDTTSAVGRAMLKLILVFAELEREQTGERTKATMEHRSRQGLWNGGRILGFDLDPDQKGVLKVNEEEARIVRDHFFAKCVELGSAGKVVRHLEELGLRTPTYESRRGRRQGGKPYTKASVLTVLTRPAYIGKISWDGGLHEGQHEAIVPEALFLEVQRILGMNRRRNRNYRDQRDHVFLLQGLVRCGTCGSHMTPRHSIGANKTKHFYYQCTREAHSAGTRCKAKYIPAPAAERFVLDELRKVAVTPEEIERIVREANGNKDELLERLGSERRDARRHLTELRDKIAQIVDVVEGGGRFSKSMAKRLEALEGEQAAVEEHVEQLRLEAGQIRRRTMSAAVMAESYRHFPAILDELREAGEGHRLKNMIGRYVEAIDWHQDEDDPGSGVVEIMLLERPRPVVEAVNHSGVCAPGCTDWLPELDSNQQPPG